MKSVDQAQSLAHDIVTRARAAGADAADAVVSSHASLNVSVRLGALEDVGRSEGEDLSLRVFCGHRNASVATSDFASAELDELVGRAIRMARESTEDKWAGLAPEDRLLNGQPPLLDLDDGGVIAPEDLRERALAAEEAARAVAGVTNSAGAGAGATRAVTALATSHGFAGGYAGTSYGVHASVLAGKPGAMERDYAHHSARHLARLEDAEGIGRRAGERAVRRLSPGRVPSGTVPVVFDRRVGGSLLGHLVGATAGPAITRKTSFLLDAMGEQIFPSGVTVSDDPHRPHGLRSRPFDGEGLAVLPVDLIEDGHLETWLLDSASARQLGLEPTGHAGRGGGVAASNLYMHAGNTSVEALIGDVARGVWVTELIGQGANLTTGDYSRGASGFLIENGEITRPIAEFTIAGNLKTMFAALTPANDLEFRYGINVPTLRIDGMTVAGD
ncbi:MAG: TldD/PmbA family protein [Sphingomonas sp.]